MNESSPNELEAAPTRADSRVSRAIGLLMVMALGIVPYLGGLDAEFLYDDVPYIVENPQVRGDDLAAVFEETLPPDQKYLGLYRPLSVLSYRWQAPGGRLQDAGSYRLVNILLHAACCVALLLVLRAWGFSFAAASLSAGAFAIHPLHVESVAWIVGRAEILSALFCILALGALKISNSALRLPLLALSFATACLCKENALSFPALLVAFSWIGLRATPTRLAIEIGVYLAIIAMVAWIRVSVVGQFGPDPTLASFTPHSLIDRLTLSIDLLGSYLQLHLWPYPSRIFYHRTEFGTPSWFDIVVIVLSAALTVWLWKRNRTVALFVLWMPFTLLSVLHLVPIQETFAERFTYLPSVGIAVLFGWAVASWGRYEIARSSRMALSVLIPSIIGFAAVVLVVRRVPDFDNSVALWTRAVETSPQFPYTHYNLGIAYENQGIIEPRGPEVRGAREAYAASLRIDPRHRFAAEAFQRLGNFEIMQRRFQTAARNYRTSIRLEPHPSILLQAFLGLANCFEYDPKSVSAEECRKALLAARAMTEDPAILSRIDVLFQKLESSED